MAAGHFLRYRENALQPVRTLLLNKLYGMHAKDNMPSQVLG